MLVKKSLSFVDLQIISRKNEKIVRQTILWAHILIFASNVAQKNLLEINTAS